MTTFKLTEEFSFLRFFSNQNADMNRSFTHGPETRLAPIESPRRDLSIGAKMGF